MVSRVHILVLSDRDWHHPQAGGTGRNLFSQVSRWLTAGHRVSVIACGWKGCERLERHGDLTIHRVGGRSTVFPRAIWKQWRGLVPDADVVLEIVNGITFLTPLWLRSPRVTLIHHIHRDHYVREMGRKGALAGYLLETAPLRFLYRGSRFMTVSTASAEEIAAHGIPREQIDLNHNGIEAAEFGPGERAPEPTLIYLGRVKRYKRIELLLDVLESVPEAKLDIAGDGEHRPELEGEIERRGLSERVRMHGHVSEERRRQLLRRAWVHLTASSAEGWCLTVMEAAACGTPSAALAVGGLRNSIEHGVTGLLADTPAELAAHARRLVREPELRQRLGRQAEARAHRFTWDQTAERSLQLLSAERRRQPTPIAPLRALVRSDTGQAAGLAAAVIASNVVALAFTIVFARVLGASGYGSLAALLSAFIILMVPGSALQIAVAREVSRDMAAGNPNAGAGVRHWMRRLLLLAAATALVAVPLRAPLGALLNVDELWAAAAVPVTSVLWAVVSIERGALQGFRRYRIVGLSIVGEALARIAFGLLLVGAGLDVTGAFLATALSLIAVGGVLTVPLLRDLPPAEAHVASRLRDLLAGAWLPVVGLTLLFALQEVHVIVIKHEASADAAGSYAVAAVAAKAIIWVAVGLGLYLLPEAARRGRQGVDAMPILGRTLALIAAAAIPMVALYAVAAKPLLEIVFGEELGQASGALPWLGLAMALLACAYLSVQYLLALGRSSFVWILGIGAALEVLVLLAIGARLTEVALALAGLQLTCAAAVLTLSFRTRGRSAGPALPIAA
jgi:glycosyltransferase involved in cell wall biosynthesis/O-antigen/teichoic acid export membrane protein